MIKEISDFDSILSLLYEFDDVFPHNKEKISDYNNWAKKIYENGEVLVIRDDGKNSGLSVFYANNIFKRIGYISLIGLKKEYQSRGQGKKLLVETFNIMKNKGMKECCLEVDKDNSVALSFYCKHCFSPVVELENSWILSRPLD